MVVVHTLTIDGIINCKRYAVISLFRARDPLGHPLKKDRGIWNEMTVAETSIRQTRKPRYKTDIERALII